MKYFAFPCVWIVFVLIAFGDSANIHYFWHITDAHVDQNYTTGADPDCNNWKGGENKDILLCCRYKTPNQTKSAGLFATPEGHCDVPMRTYQGSLDFLKKYQESQGISSDFVFYTGDTPAHDEIDQSYSGNRDEMLLVLKMITTSLGSDVKIFPTFGNLDTFPAGQLDNGLGGAWILEPLSQLMYGSGWVDNKTANFLKEKGYYSLLLSEKLRLVALNTQLTCPINLWVWDYDLKKHHRMAEWFTEQLVLAKQNGEKVIIMGHIPLFDGMVFKKWNEEFVSIIEQHGEVIVLQLFGHKHDDQFEIQVNDQGDPVGVSLCASSITTKTGKNPSVRLIEFDMDELEVVDIKTFYNDINKSNLEGSMEGNWHFEYSMKEFYGLDDFSPASFQGFAKQLETNQTVFDQFYLYYHASYSPKECGESCKKELLCETKFTLTERIEKCKG